jgi:carbonic anhydrase/acetyltransferase-like protein (isoleucine patch superfamily)
MSEASAISPAVRALRDRGVVFTQPATVEVEASVRPERIAAGAVIHAGCRLRGAATSIGPGAVVGEEAPATVADCQLGGRVSLKGGYFSGATFLDGASVGSAAHVRSGTLIEEQAGGAHAVGFKQTILFPFVTAGSLINFCDALMAGGTSRQNHSEIGSSYIHFNFTAHQDKATASLVGDVPRGVMLDQPPIFLGGQGGLVGPVRIAFGCVVAAGVILRRDALEPGMLVAGGAEPARRRPSPGSGRPTPYRPEVFGTVERILVNNLHYLGNLRALQAWYERARWPRMESDPYRLFCWEGARENLDRMVEERLRRLDEWVEKVGRSVELLRSRGGDAGAAGRVQQERVLERWPALKAALVEGPDERAGAADRDAFLAAWDSAGPGRSHLDAVAGLSPDARRRGTDWLQAVVDSVVGLWQVK